MTNKPKPYLPLTEPEIRRGNKDSHRNENRNSLENIFSVGKKIDKHTFFYEN